MNICVFCGSNFGKNENFEKVARELGREIALRGDRLVYGGGKRGLMGVVARSALDSGGEVIGVMPHILIEKELALDGLTEFIKVKDMSERKLSMIEKSDAFVLLPGGIGSLEEFFDVYSASQLSTHTSPIVIFNIDSYYDPVTEMINNVVEEGFAPEIDKNLFIVVEDASEMYEKMLDFKHVVGVKHK